jgi:ribonuclease HII
VFKRLSLEGTNALRQPCPDHVVHQCWPVERESFVAEPELVARTAKHLGHLAQRGVQVIAVRSSVLCTHRLNLNRAAGHNRFVSDLHAMERLVLALREQAGEEIHAVCGKVGGIGDYARFFGPLSGQLHVELEKRRAQSSYKFPRVGELHFVQDADARDPLVMLASLVGKWVRELLMDRVVRFYPAIEEEPNPSGYHDPITARFVQRTALNRRKRRVPDSCFERDREQ